MARVFTIGLLLAALPLWGAARIKELAGVEGVRDNSLIGYGLVVGLAGTGDSRQAVFAAQSLSGLLQRMGVSVPPAALRVRNTAAVLLTATLPAFAQPGTRIDVTTSSIGDAANLQGGLLVMSPLKGPDGQVYAVAQGSIVTGGFQAGRGGNSQTLNHPTAGRIPNGAIVERDPPSLAPKESLRLQLKQSDFTTAARIAAAVNRTYGEPLAKAETAGLVRVEIPPAYRERAVEFVAEVEALTVESDRPSKIIISERTGTISLGRNVRLSPVSVLHGGLTIQIQTTLDVSQPNRLASGSTVVTPQVDVRVREERARNVALQEGATVDDLVRALLAIGSTPRDIIAILQTLRAAGALEAEVEVI